MLLERALAPTLPAGAGGLRFPAPKPPQGTRTPDGRIGWGSCPLVRIQEIHVRCAGRRMHRLAHYVRDKEGWNGLLGQSFDPGFAAP